MMVTSIESSKKELDPILNLPTQHLSSQDLLSSNEQEGDLIYKRQSNILNTEKTTARDPQWLQTHIKVKKNNFEKEYV